MTPPLKLIAQSGVRALLSARFEHPEQYVDKPLFIWQAIWLDSIQLQLSMDVMRQDVDKTEEQQRCFRIITLHPGKDYLEKFTKPRKGVTVGYLVYPGESLSLPDCLKEVEKVIAANECHSPLVVYLPYNYQNVSLPGEQYIFAPDFEQWAPSWQETFIPDFIRGDGDKDGIIYRFYNYFNDPHKGCATPLLWDALGYILHGFVIIERKSNKDYDIKDLDEHTLRLAFKGAIEKSKSNISTDIIDDFVKYLKNG